MRCPRCDGRPHWREHGCVSCDDTGQAPDRPEPVMRWHLPDAARESAWLALRAPLLEARVPDFDAASRRIVAALQTEPMVEVVIGLVCQVAGPLVTPDHAHRIVRAYVDAVAQASRVAELWLGSRDEAPRIREHAVRIERALPRCDRVLG